MTRIERLYDYIFELYQQHKEKLLFHGWHHINFVYKKSTIFAKELEANIELVQAAALTHDLNYIVSKGSKTKDGKEIRSKILKGQKFSEEEIKIINIIVEEACISNKTNNVNISLEAQALSDADSVFKVIPITPLLFTSKYIEETDVDIKYLADTIIISKQEHLIEKDIFFYSKLAKEKYNELAKFHLQLWKHVSKSLEDEDISEVLEIAKSSKVL